ncbi:MAG: tetratricopeptide repeat protein [Bacteroidota bacterium]|nr:tetratricopeptide repeat protein [Bacteroidota bacterium]
MLRYILILITLLLAVWSCNPNKSGHKEKNKQEIADSSSIEFITAQINAGNKNPELFVRRAKLFVEQEKFNPAINDMEIALAVDSTNTDYLLLLAEYQLLTGKSGKAKESLDKCIWIDPENTNAILKLAEIHLYVEQYRESMDYILKAQNLDMNNARVYFIKSLIFKETGDTIRALESLFTSVEKNPEYYDAWMLLGSLHAVKQDSLTLQFFRNALRVVPNSIEAYYNMAMFYQNNNNPEKALRTYDDLLEKAEPDYLFAIYNKAYIYLHFMDDLDKAIELFTKSIELKNNYYQAWHNRGFAYEQKREFVPARKDYEKAIQIMPNYPLSIEGLNRLDKKEGK